MKWKAKQFSSMLQRYIEELKKEGNVIQLALGQNEFGVSVCKVLEELTPDDTHELIYSSACSVQKTFEVYEKNLDRFLKFYSEHVEAFVNEIRDGKYILHTPFDNPLRYEFVQENGVKLCIEIVDYEPHGRICAIEVYLPLEFRRER